MNQQNNKKPYILKAFREMDIEMLKLLLNNDQEYEDFPKDVFLNFLDVLFKQFREKGDTYLRAMPGCCSKSRGCNKGLGGYHFTGNKSHCYTPFIFEEDENDFKDIYYCTYFTPQEGIQNLGEKIYFGSTDQDFDIPSWLEEI